ncbi:MAG: 3-dehydroquinate synthase [Lachnospiraceae bacterium]|nr:3-dehydroquinate synthase [Lachnospiraceae bacterium]
MHIQISSQDLSYDIIYEKGALSHLGDYLNTDRKALIVTDSGVPADYAKKAAACFKEAFTVTIPQGEQSKNIDNYLLILKKMLEANFTRKDCVVAVGGGVCGDLAAFSASCYMRGLQFYNIPTTVLAMVDSSIGGKTAIDFEGVKNVVGSFYQPSAVIIDTETLETLDTRQVNAGLAEAVKMAATNDAELFDYLEKCDDYKAHLEEIIKRANAIKRSVVEEDPQEKGLRKVLNFGHTVGHAIESAAKGKLLHGECVAIGMLLMCSDEAGARIEKILKKYSLPTECGYDTKDLVDIMKHDKKANDKGVSCVWVDRIGSFEFRNMSWDELAERGRK